MNLYLCRLVQSNYVISAFQQGHQAFPLVKVKPTDGNASTLSTKEKEWCDSTALWERSNWATIQWKMHIQWKTLPPNWATAKDETSGRCFLAVAVVDIPCLAACMLSLILIESSLMLTWGDTEVFSQMHHTFFDKSAFTIEQVRLAQDEWQFDTFDDVDIFCQAIPIFLPAHLIMEDRYSMSLITWSSISCGIICFASSYLFCILYILFCKGLVMMGSDKIRTASCTYIHDKIHTASHTYIHVLSLCHLYPLPVTWRVTNVNFQKILFLCTPLTTLHLREMN
jgi:hypothetical protein